MKKLFITGSTGNVGIEVIKALQKIEHNFQHWLKVVNKLEKLIQVRKLYYEGESDLRLCSYTSDFHKLKRSKIMLKKKMYIGKI